MLLTKSLLVLAAAYQASAFNYNVTLSPNDSNICVEVLGDETGQGVYPVKCPAICGQLEGSEFNAGKCEGTTGSEVYAHVNNQNEVDYIRISNQYNYRFPCHSVSSNTFLCQGWLDPPSSATSSATSFVTFTSALSSSANSSLSASPTSIITTSVFTATSSSSASVNSSVIPSSILATSTSTVVTATSSSLLPSSSGCIEGSKGKHLGDGYRGYCCSSNDDCWNRCKRGTCNGPLAPPAAPTVTPTNCSKGTEGKMKGDGLLGDCCYSSADCKEKCVNGTCNAPPS